MIFGRRERLATKSPDELRAMRRAGRLVAQALEAAREACVPGAQTIDLDAVAEATILSAGARPAFPEVPGYRHTLCVSVNEAVVHGIPGSRVLRAGDLVSIDCGAIVDGWYGDAAITVHCGGQASAGARDSRLNDVTREALWAGIGAFAVGGRVGDIGAAVEDRVHAAGPPGYGIVTEYEGHGIGRSLHTDPGVPNVGGTTGPRIRSGAVLAIEPMVTLGAPDTVELDDDWTVVTTDGSWAAHWEHTVAVTDDGLWVLTAHDGGEAELAARGLPFAPLSD